MKVHYINILLFALQLNIFVTLYHVRNKNKPYITHNTTNTKRLKTHRTLCECDIYASNYDNDPEMKALMENFNLQTSQRFREYDERIQEKRRKCKEKCDKEMQQIILKDKVEKELTEKLVALQTHIDLDDLPECTCKKSVAEKTENFCLKCGYGLESVVPSVGLYGAIAVHQWTKAATAAATQKGIEAGINVVIDTLKRLFNIEVVTDLKWKTLITAQNYTDKILVGDVIRKLGSTLCGGSEETGGKFCLFTVKANTLPQAINGHVPKAISEGTAEVVTVTKAEMEKVTTIGGAYSTGIIVSVVVIVIIVLVMIIIYLILRYRRKKKMKKKLQYIKLLEE
ncbi:hypothetical protein PFDG_04427 [Plasmodium falciparum Dd2]|uniref:Rifin n=1 Tax=Plasmodium falciparum (isolate Dd2) TaxID=57267 RepID=A0A0L7M500_PLAF4|nr:hypothetical protein PFDG_04427 [Plasmodium falciparum Dd2]